MKDIALLQRAAWGCGRGPSGTEPCLHQRLGWEAEPSRAPEGRESNAASVAEFMLGLSDFSAITEQESCPAPC